MKALETEKEGRIIQLYPNQIETQPISTQRKVINSKPVVDLKENTEFENLTAVTYKINSERKEIQNLTTVNSAINFEMRNEVEQWGEPTPITNIENSTVATFKTDIENSKKVTSITNTENSTESTPVTNTLNSTESTPVTNTLNSTESTPITNTLNSTESTPITNSENLTESTPVTNTEKRSIETVKIKPNTYNELRRTASEKNDETSTQVIDQKQKPHQVNENIEEKSNEMEYDERTTESNKDKKISSSPTIETDEEREDKTYPKIKYKEKSSTLYVKLFALFFFLGVCLCASGKLKTDSIGKKLISFVNKDLESFFSFCVNLSPLVFSSFVVFAGGFTLYAPFITWVYSAIVFLVLGILSGYIVTSFAINFAVIMALLIIGIFSVLNVVLCSVSVGMSKIAINGIKEINLSDGIIYFIVYAVYIMATWGIFVGIKALIG